MSTTTERQKGVTTTVDVKATGNVRRALDEHRFDFTFEGTTLREFLDAFFAEYGCADLILATDDNDRTKGWARYPGEGTPPGRWVANPEGERTRRYARVLINGKFNELLDGFDTELEDGDRIALMQPFMYCC
ncbi:MoaD/ThiS family protein [Halorarius litoreus]|uniref:MoaD/ThiS family protein n=1 Tax=Halorarius litoreus TaxID=2962676 RepID=UPI0020CC4979|nr:MoaD/ThiS family protein [Halorarius litoreus]